MVSSVEKRAERRVRSRKGGERKIGWHVGVEELDVLDAACVGFEFAKVEGVLKVVSAEEVDLVDDAVDVEWEQACGEYALVAVNVEVSAENGAKRVDADVKAVKWEKTVKAKDVVLLSEVNFKGGWLVVR